MVLVVLWIFLEHSEQKLKGSEECGRLTYPCVQPQCDGGKLIRGHSKIGRNVSRWWSYHLNLWFTYVWGLSLAKGTRASPWPHGWRYGAKGPGMKGPPVYSYLGTNPHHMVFGCGATSTHLPLGYHEGWFCGDIRIDRRNWGIRWSPARYIFSSIWWSTPSGGLWGTNLGYTDAGYC